MLIALDIAMRVVTPPFPFESVVTGADTATIRGGLYCACAAR